MVLKATRSDITQGRRGPGKKPWDFLKCREMEDEDSAKETEMEKPLIEE